MDVLVLGSVTRFDERSSLWRNFTLFCNLLRVQLGRIWPNFGRIMWKIFIVVGKWRKLSKQILPLGPTGLLGIKRVRVRECHCVLLNV